MGSFLLVGGSSDIGLGLCERLVENQHKVIIVARDETRLKNLNDDSVVKIIGDANNEDVILSLIHI